MCIRDRYKGMPSSMSFAYIWPFLFYHTLFSKSTAGAQAPAVLVQNSYFFHIFIFQKTHTGTFSGSSPGHSRHTPRNTWQHTSRIYLISSEIFRSFFRYSACFSRIYSVSCPKLPKLISAAWYRAASPFLKMCIRDRLWQYDHRSFPWPLFP